MKYLLAVEAALAAVSLVHAIPALTHRNHLETSVERGREKVLWETAMAETRCARDGLMLAQLSRRARVIGVSVVMSDPRNVATTRKLSRRRNTRTRVPKLRKLRRQPPRIIATRSRAHRRSQRWRRFLVSWRNLKPFSRN